MDIFREFTFEAAHQIPKLPEWHKCGRLHGHSYKVEVWLRAPVPSGRPWFYDWGELVPVFEEIMERLDHRFLNEIPGLEVPSCENLAVYIWGMLRFARVPHLYKLKIYEGFGPGLEYFGPVEGWE